MPIDIYLNVYSPPSCAVRMTAKHLNIDLNIKNIDLSEGQHFDEEYLKMNPSHRVPAINDNGFILWESRAIMQYLCNQYAPDSTLYPKQPKQRALVDRWLNFDLSLFETFRESIAKPMFTGIDPTEAVIKSQTDNLKLLDQLIGDNKYLVGNQLTIADISLLATTSLLFLLDWNLAEYPHFKSWAIELQSELPYYDEINKFNKDEVFAFIEKMKTFMAKQMQLK